MNTMKEKYGVNDLSFAEEIKLAKEKPFEARTRNSKIAIVNDLEAIAECAHAYVNKARRIPEENSAEHAELVEKWKNEIHSVLVRLIDSYGYCSKTWKNIF